jgi:hypothetical protein
MYTISLGINPINVSSDLENKDYTLEDLNEFFSNPKRLSNTRLTFNKITKLNLPWWSGAHYMGSRNAQLLTARNLITLDVDFGDKDTLDLIKSKLDGIVYFVHTTVSYAPDSGNYKYRIVIPSAKQLINKDDYINCVNYFMNLLGAHIFDVSTSTDITRAMFSPAVLKNEEYHYYYNSPENGNLIYTPDFDPSQPNIKLKRLPSTRTDLEGYFCRVYNAVDIMIEYALPTNDYKPQGDMHSPLTRWSYVYSSGTAGIRFEENGELLHCDHETCPLLTNKIKDGDKQWSAYDLYVYFNHNGNIKEAEDVIRRDAKVMTLFTKNFEDLSEAENLTNQVCIPVTVDEIKRLKSSNDANKLKDFILSRAYKMVGKNIEYIFPIISSVGDFVEFNRVTAGKPCAAFFGDASLLSADGKKTISIWSIIDKVAPSYTGFKFEPYNPLTPVSYVDSFKINTFTGYAAYPVEDYKDCEVIEKFTHYIRHYVCSENIELYTWVMDWIADIFQNPASKKGTAIYLYSHEKGLGKSTFYNLLNMLLGNLSAKVEASKLGQRFNAEISSKLLVFIDEVTYELKKSSAVLRDSITSETNSIERKGFETTIEKNCARYLLAGNFKDAIEFDENNDERRFTVINMVNRIDDDIKRSNYFDDLTRTCLKYKNELLTYLLNHKITSNLTNKFTTDFYKECAKDNVSPIDSFLKELLSSDLKTLESIFNTNSFDINVTERKNSILITKQAFKAYFESIYDKVTNFVFNKMMTNSRERIVNKIEFNGKPMVINSKTQRCVIIPKESFKLDLDDL